MDDVEITNLKNFAAGVNERIFIINSDVLQPGDINNEVVLELNISEEENNLNSTYSTYILKDSINISIQALNQNRDISLNSVEGINKVMDNNFELDTTNLIGIDAYKFYYRLLIKDEHNEIIPIKQRKELDPIIEKQQKKINLMLPIFKNFFFELSNNREERYIASNIAKINQNSYIKFNNLTEILKEANSDNYNEIEKIFLIMKYLDINKNSNLNGDYDDLFDFIDNKLTEAVKEGGFFESQEPNEINYSNETNTYHINYYEPKTIFSLLNKLFLNQKENIPDKYYNIVIKIFKDFLDSLLNNKNNIKLDNSNILSFFRTFDHFVSIYINKAKITGEDIINKESIYDILNKLSEYLVTDTYSGETIKLVGKKISLFLSHFGEFQNHLSFASVNNISDKLKYDDYSTFSFDDYNINEESCSDDGDILLCIQSKNYKEFKEKVENIEDYILSLITINKNKDNFIQNENEGNSFQLKIINSKNLTKTYNNLGFFYDIEFPFNYIPPSSSFSSSSNNNITELYLQQDNNNNIEKDYSNIACVPKNNLKNKDLYCLTYFNYETNLIKCSCNVMDEITYVNNPDIAKFYKDLQSKGKFKTYKPLNKISLYAVFGLLAFLLLPNLIYLLYEIKNDIKKAKYKLFNYSKRIKEKYLSAKPLNNTSIFSFSILSFIYKFPFLSPLRNCNIQTPKYIKHFIVTLALSYGVIISLILFLLYYPFKEKQEIIDKRDIKNPDYEIIDSHIIFKYFNSGIVFSFFGLMISILFVYIFGIILSYNNDELKYWKNMKSLLDNYICNDIKKEVLLGSFWKKIKLRMLAYCNICGNYILSKKTKKRKINQNLEKYLKTSQSKKRDNDNDNQLLPLDLDEEMRELSEKNSNSGKYRPPSISQKNIINDSNEHLSIGAINDSRNSINLDLQVVPGEKFQLYGAKVKVDKSIEKNKKFERIKNRYICKKPNNISLEEEMEYPDSRSASIETIKFYKDLTIEYENNLSFIAINEFLINKTITKNSNKKWISSYSSMNYKLEGYWLLVYISFILTILLLVLIFLMFKLLKLFLNDFGSFIIFVWVSTSIIIYIIVYPLLYYIKILIGTILLFKCYHLRNKAFGRFLYWVFVDKTMIYIFKVRNFITKYKKEFDY